MFVVLTHPVDCIRLGPRAPTGMVTGVMPDLGAELVANGQAAELTLAEFQERLLMERKRAGMGPDLPLTVGTPMSHSWDIGSPPVHSIICIFTRVIDMTPLAPDPSDPYDPRNLTLPEGHRLAVPAKAVETKAGRRKGGKLPRHGPGEHFLRGPVPMGWLDTAARLPGRVLHVGVALWWLAWLRKEGVNPVRWRPSAGERFGLDRKAVYRGLGALEAAGLVRIERHRGRCPVVTLLPNRPNED